MKKIEKIAGNIGEVPGKTGNIERITKFFKNDINIIVCFVFFFMYTESRILFHTFDLREIPFFYKLMFHIGFYIPLGIFLWRTEFSILKIVIVLFLLSGIPEVYQHFFMQNLWMSNLLDFSSNLVGGIIGIFASILWTLKGLLTK